MRHAFTWLYSIATTHCLQQLRNAKLRACKLASLGEELPSTSVSSSSPDERVRAMALLEGFPLDVQQIVYLRHIDGLDVEEVSRATQLSTRTVSRKLNEFAERSRQLAARDAAEDAARDAGRVRP